MGIKELLDTKFETTANEIINAAEAIINESDMPTMSSVSLMLVAAMIGKRLAEKKCVESVINDVEDNQ